MPRESRDSKRGNATGEFLQEARAREAPRAGGHADAHPEYGAYGEYGELAEEGELGEYDELAEELADEAPEGDAAEQRLELLRLRDTPLTERARDDADPADAAEQARVVDPGDDDYR